MKPIQLASRSPRRRDLLKQIGVRFETLLVRLAAPRGAAVDEVQFEGEAANDYVVRTAREKAEFDAQAVRVRGMIARPVLSADTAVILDGEELRKLANAAEATATLRRLAGRSDEVRTAVAIAMAPDVPTLETVSISTVRFRAITDAEIRHYVQALASLTTRPAPAASRATPASLSSGSRAAIPASWVCPCSRPPNSSAASESG